MIEDLGDFSEENGTFRVVKEDPLTVEISPKVFPNEPADNAAYEVKRAAVYAIYRTFIHTKANSITLTAFPLQFTPGKSEVSYLKSPKVAINTTRERALSVIKGQIKVDSFSALVAPEKAGSMQLDHWSKSFENVYYKEPQLNKLVDSLTSE
ncbi:MULTISPECIES: hypothetical protein [unclassified Pseudomonas]|uniref:hypothetical protein n=1 Tax=unclassified Pseudomonas TaxID=196821 RepID=UPI00235E9AD2|nr:MULTISPECIES: hypothetical protein [unclassified Pseudomonas]